MAPRAGGWDRSPSACCAKPIGPLLVAHAGDAPPALLVERVELHAFETPGDRAAAWIANLAAPGGTVVDRRSDETTTPGAARGTTLVAIAVPEPRTPRWLARYAEPWLRGCQVPVVFIPDENEKNGERS